jgi:glycosyltransferase involved in cell wall biosynthesis
MPLPTSSGDTIRNWAMIRAVRRAADRLDIVSLSQPRGEEARAGAAEVRELVDHLELGDEVMSDLLRAPGNRLRSLLGRPYHDAVGRSAFLREAVRERLRSQEYDAVVVSQIFVVSALPERERGRAVLDTHNVETERMRLVLGKRGGAAALAGRPLLAGVARLERAALRTCAVTVACSDRDAAQLRELEPTADVRVVANPLDLPEQVKEQRERANTLLFLASLDYSANIDSLEHLVDDVLPHLPPEVVVQVAGSNAGPAAEAVLARAGGRVQYLGYVPDARATMRDADVFIVPLRFGSGVRLKIPEALGVGLPVVTTPKGCEGLPTRSGEHLVIAEDPAEFARAAVDLLASVDRRRALAAAGRAMVEQQASWSTVTSSFVDTVSEVAAR